MAIHMLNVRVGREYDEIKERHKQMRAELTQRYNDGALSASLYYKYMQDINAMEEMRIIEVDRLNRGVRDADLGFRYPSIMNAPYKYSDPIPAPAQGIFYGDEFGNTDAMYGTEDGELSIGNEHMNILKTKVVGVKFLNNNCTDVSPSSTQYAYFTDIMDLAKDDYCIVIGSSGGPALVKVTDDALISKAATKMIVCKIDLTEYNEKLKVMVARTAALKRLKQIEEEQSAQEKYKHLAEKSPEAAELLKLLGLIGAGDGAEVAASLEHDPTTIDGTASEQDSAE